MSDNHPENAALAAGLDGELQRVDEVATPVDRLEVLRYVGYPANVDPDDSLLATIDHWMAEAADRATPRAVWRVLPVAELDRRRIRVRSGERSVEFEGAIGEFLSVSKRLAVFIATAGPGVEALATELLEDHEYLPGLIVNAVGAERAEAAEAVVAEQLAQAAAPVGLAPTMPYSPGYCGMELTEQTKLFSLFEEEETAGVTLTPAYLMRPLKSVSGLIGLGPADEVDAHGSPCDRCQARQCAMRR